MILNAGQSSWTTPKTEVVSSPETLVSVWNSTQFHNSKTKTWVGKLKYTLTN